MCERCADLQQQVEIRSPREFAQALRVIRGNLADGTLIVDKTSVPGSTDDLQTIRDEGPWPDVIDQQFRCAACGQRFKLAVDTYHGAGGTWKPVPKSGGTNI